MSKQKLVDYNQVQKLMNTQQQLISNLVDNTAKTEAKNVVLTKQNKQFKNLLTGIKKNSSSTKLKQINDMDTILKTIEDKTAKYVQELMGVEDQEFDQLMDHFGDTDLS